MDNVARLRILWLSHFVPYPPKGGCFQRSYNLIKEVSRKNDVYLVAMRHKGKSTHPESEMQMAKDELGKFCKEVFIVDISSFLRIRFLWLAFKSIFSSDPLTVNLFKSKKIHGLIQRLTKTERFDIAHYDTISLAEYFADTGAAPKFLTHHGMESFMIRRRAINEKNIIKKIYFLLEGYKLQRYEKANCHKFNLNIMVSEDDKLKLEEISPSSRTMVVENGVDVHFFSKKKNHDDNKQLIFAGRMDQYSNVNAMIYFISEIWPIIKKRIPDIGFTMIGNNPPFKLIEEVNKNEGVDILGYVHDVRPYFNDATISICPIRDGGGTRLKILDAMAMGMPIISTTIGCEGIDVKPGKDIIIANNPEEFVESVEKLLKDKIFREKISIAARETAESRYSWEIIAHKLNSCYRECVN